MPGFKAGSMTKSVFHGRDAFAVFYVIVDRWDAFLTQVAGQSKSTIQS